MNGHTVLIEYPSPSFKHFYSLHSSKLIRCVHHHHLHHHYFRCCSFSLHLSVSHLNSMENFLNMVLIFFSLSLSPFFILPANREGKEKSNMLTFVQVHGRWLNITLYHILCKIFEFPVPFFTWQHLFRRLLSFSFLNKR